MRPNFEDIESGAEFNRWYWLKEEMLAICKSAGLPRKGSKFQLRDRIMYALDNEGALLPEAPQAKKKSKFNWAKEPLSLQTPITDSISFGPNFRKFMEAQIGPRYKCHTVFMKWARENEGKTLQDAVAMWLDMEQRMKDPDFKSDIADHNMLCQYLRDFSEDNPKASAELARKCWHQKRRLPMKEGFVRYESSDLNLVK